jgi:hypothetical protein
MRMSEEGHAWVHLILVGRGMSWKDCWVPLVDGKVITRHYWFEKEKRDGRKKINTDY